MLSEHFNKLSGPSRNIVVAALLVATGAALLLIGMNLRSQFFPPKPPERVAMTYFYDQNTGEIFDAPYGLEGPLETKSGNYRGMPAGVRAIVLSCGQCSDAEQRFVGWLEVHSAAVQAAGQTLPPRPPSDIEEYAENSLLMVRTLNDEQWHFFQSTTGQRLVNQALRRCSEGQVLLNCDPPPRLVKDVDRALLKAAQAAIVGQN